MGHLPLIVYDLALILMTAGLVTLIFRKLRQPVVLGYIMAGFLVGPHMPWMPTVTEIDSIRVWAEIGVIFLLFALGLEFSFRKLLLVGPQASITAVFEVLFMILIGYGTGLGLGWTPMESLFLGGILSISSTTIIIRAFEEFGLKTRGFANLVFGILIVEDLVAILLMVMLSTFAAGASFSGLSLGTEAAKLFFFLTIWIVSGIFLLPTLMRKTRQWVSDETLLVSATGLCFLMVIIANKAGFSAALGAFIIGAILAETSQGAKIEQLIQPVRDLFAAIFFVSIGMLIRPDTIIEHWRPVLVIAAVTIMGKLVSTVIGAVLSGRSFKHSVQAGMSLAQIGEFSFLIAALGLSLQVTSERLYTITVAVSAITTFTTPYMIRWTDPFFEQLIKRLPARWLRAIESLESHQRPKPRSRPWKSIVQLTALRLIVNSIMILGVFKLIQLVVVPWLISQDFGRLEIQIFAFAIGLVLSSPFFWILLRPPARSSMLAHDSFERRAAIGVWIIQSLIAIMILITQTSELILDREILPRALPAGFLILLALLKVLQPVYVKIETLFIGNLNQNDSHTEPITLPNPKSWEGHVATLSVLPESPLVGLRLDESKIREHFGVSIVFIERGRLKIPAPNRHQCLYPHDRISVIGSDQQIQALKAVLEFIPPESPNTETNFNYEVRPLLVTDDSSYRDKTLGESGIGEKTRGLVVGIERGEHRKLNPDSKELIRSGDVLWIAGDRAHLNDLR